MTNRARFNRLSISVRDFERSVAFALRASEVPAGSLEYQALVFASIVSYYRPFTPNERKPSEGAESYLKFDDFKSPDAQMSELHEKCKNLRNRALAHSEHEMNPTERDSKSGVVWSKPFDLLEHAPSPIDIAKLAGLLAEECHRKRAKSSDQYE